MSAFLSGLGASLLGISVYKLAETEYFPWSPQRSVITAAIGFICIIAAFV